MKTESLRHPRWVWRHFAINIVSPAILTFALFFGLIFVLIIPAMKRNTVERKKEMIRELTQAAWSELATLHEQENQGVLTREAAQQTAIARIQNIRYGDDRKDYFWLSDLDTRMVMHPYLPELNGQDLSTYSDPGGKRLFVEYTRIVREQGDGYVEYLWQWKDDEQRVVPKLSYVMGFPPWGWIIGTGIYIEDVRAEIRRMIGQVLQVSMGISVVIAGLLAYIAKQGLDLERRRWKAESALRESEEKYRMLVEGMTEGILMLIDDHPVYANKTLLNLLGYREEELARLPLEKIVEPIHGGNGTSTPGQRRARLLHRNGEATDVLLASAPVIIGDREGQILSIKDVAARKKTEETLSRLLAELQSMLPLATRSIKGSPLAMAACELDTPIQKAAAIMVRAGSSAVLVNAPSGEPVGIVTDQDLRARVLAEGRGAQEAVSTIMTAPLQRIQDRALLFEAARVMQEREVRHLVVTDERGGTVGILTGTHVLHAQRHAIGALLGEIEVARSPEELKDSRAKVPVFVKALLESGARVETVTRIMTAVSDAVLVRLISLAEAELGQAPAPYSFVVLGSEAREEQTLATDQDNAIIFDDMPSGQNEAAQAWFLKLGETVCGWLDLVGYRRCRGEVMACNPKWCQPWSRWRDYFTGWVREAAPQDLLEMNVFFDFRCAHGDVLHIQRLRQHLNGLLEDGGQNAFFFLLAQSTLQFRPPRGFFGNIQLESSREHQGTFNIKAAIIPLVNFARMYALRHGFAETNTLERFHRLRDAGILLPSSHDELVQAYGTLMQMRLTHQAGQLSRGIEADNLVDLAELTELDRSVLKKVFADITIFQARLEIDFARTA